MNIKVTMAKLQEIIKEELDMIDVSDDIVEEEDDDNAFRAFTSVMDYLREDVFPKLSETELYDFGYEMHKFFKTYGFCG